MRIKSFADRNNGIDVVDLDFVASEGDETSFIKDAVLLTSVKKEASGESTNMFSSNGNIPVF